MWSVNRHDSYLFCGFRDIANNTPIMAKRKRNMKNVVAPVMLCIPQTMIKSNMKINKYKTPTIFITNIPDSSVAGPVSTQGKIAGQRYVAA